MWPLFRIKKSKVKVSFLGTGQKGTRDERGGGEENQWWGTMGK